MSKFTRLVAKTQVAVSSVPTPHLGIGSLKAKAHSFAENVKVERAVLQQMREDKVEAPF